LAEKEGETFEAIVRNFHIVQGAEIKNDKKFKSFWSSENSMTLKKREFLSEK
jgi:hypothetical protein